jgi:hypothetical protein
MSEDRPEYREARGGDPREEVPKPKKPRTKKSTYAAYREAGEGMFERIGAGFSIKQVVSQIEKQKLEGVFIIACERTKIKSGTQYKIERA